MENIVVVSADGHAVMPPELWAKYLDKKYHKYLDRLRRETNLFTGSMLKLNDLRFTPETGKIFDKDGAYFGGKWRGLWDSEIRLSEMDREGVAAEFVFPGDLHASELFYSTMNGTYALDAVDAGVHAYNHWAYDTFGAAKDRLYLIGPAGTFRNFDASVAEANWMADHGFVGVFTPGFCAFPGQPPLFDPYWEQLWSVYAERNLVLITHGGYGFDQGFAFAEVEAAADRVTSKGGGDMDLVSELATTVFTHSFFEDLRCRQAMWQMMLGGVFDRHPKLKMMMTEVRADWIPGALKLADEFWEKNRQSLPAKRPPSEYWRSNCMAGVSFMHKSEVDLRHEIGVESIAFGRDYPHPEGTWPNTRDYLRGLFGGVPEHEVRAMLGENLIGFLGLNRAKLKAISDKIGPTYQRVAGPGADVDPALIAHLNERCGLFEAPEGNARTAEMRAILQADLGRLSAVSTTLGR